MPTRAFLVCLVVAAAPSTVLAQVNSSPSFVGFTDSEGTPNYKPDNWQFYPTIKLQMVTYSDVGGTDITDQYDCNLQQNCPPGRDGEPYAHYRVTLVGVGGTNAEFISGTCANAPGSSAETTCFDNPLRVTLRVKTGKNTINMVGADNGMPHIVRAGVDIRYRIPGPYNVYWVTGSGGANRFPQGTWQPEVTTPPSGHCHPVPVDPNFTVTVDALDRPEVNWFWTGTVCDYRIVSLEGGGTVTDGLGNIIEDNWSCTLPRGSETVCEFSAPYGEEVRLIATSPDYSPYFRQLNSVCGYSEPDDVCRFDADEDIDITLAFLDGGTEAPSFTASAGSRGPSSRAAAKGDTDVSVQALHFTVDDAPAMTSMVIHAGGTGAPASDITAAKVFIDMNANGAVDSGDFRLGTGTFDADGNALVTFDEPYQQNTAFDLVVGVDFNTEIQAGFDVPLAPWSLLAVAALPVLLMRRRRGLAVAVVACAIAASVACGSGGGGGDQDTDDDQQGDGVNTGDDDQTGDDDYVPPAGSKTYVFSVTAASAQQSYAITTPAQVNGLPLNGATISVAP